LTEFEFIHVGYLGSETAISFKKSLPGVKQSGPGPILLEAPLDIFPVFNNVDWQALLDYLATHKW
jgi:hypothetical protein